MLKKIKKNVDMYMCDKQVMSFNLPECKDQCYTFGYLDGYFDEKMYIEYVNNSSKCEEKLLIYNDGYEKGLKDRTRIRYNDPDLLKKEKIEWIKKLSLHDALNNVDSRNLNDDSMTMYEKYKTGLFHLGKMDFVDERKYTIHKR